MHHAHTPSGPVSGPASLPPHLPLSSDVLDLVANAIVITNRDGIIEWANSAFTRATGYTLAESLGQRPGHLLGSGCHPRDFYTALWSTILAGQVWHGEIINRRKDGQLCSEDMTITPLRDEHGVITRFVAVKQDITRRKQVEEQHRQAQKMEAVGQLAGGVAHDFNNILAAVMMHLGLLQEERSLPAHTRTTLQELSEEIKRGAGLTRQLLAFSRQQAMEPRHLDLHDLVGGLVKMLRRLLGENIHIELAEKSTATAVKADPGMMEQIVINLCINARDAMPRGGHLQLRTDLVELTAATAASLSGARPGHFVRLSVTDTGEGIAPENLPHLFEPFFTTKQIGHGTGLGLATVHGIAQQHGGWVAVNSVIGQGTTFHIYLPACAVLPAADAPVAPATPPAGRGETILLAEDEASVRQTIAITLRHFGYQVLEAEDGPTALRLWQQDSARIDLLLTDIIMPNGLSGQDLVHLIRRERPAVKVIACTGYSPSQVCTTFIPPTRVTLLHKPFDPVQLLVAVRASLDQP